MGKRSGKKGIKTCEKGVVAPWPDLNRDVLSLVMMQLGVVDFLAFAGVCKSWRSLALSNKNKFMASKPPMSMCISSTLARGKKECRLVDFEGRKFKTTLPHSASRTFVGLTRGYLILYGWETKDFWLVNPITRHKLYFPNVPFCVSEPGVTGILVVSPSLSEWALVMIDKMFTHQIWVSVAGKRTWNHVYSTLPIGDLHLFKGKIYTINPFIPSLYDVSKWELCELTSTGLNPNPKLTLTTKNNFPNQNFISLKFVSSGENLYLFDTWANDRSIVYELDFDEMKWVPFEKTRDAYAFYLDDLQHGVAFKAGPCVDSQLFERKWRLTSVDSDKGEKGKFFSANLWYFPHECLSVNVLRN